MKIAWCPAAAARPATVFVLAQLLLLLAASPAPASDPLAERVEQVRSWISSDPQPDAALFHPVFLAQVPMPRIIAVLKEYHAASGEVVRVVKTDERGPFFAEYRFITADGASFPVKLGIESEPPHRIQTAWFGLAQPGFESTRQVLEELAALSGEVSFAFCRLTDDGVVAEHAVSPDLRLALGSAFKLYLLGALAEDVASGRLQWDTVVRLDPARRSWPSGMTQEWPAGAPVTLATLATLMISISDNTATDHLLFELGRERVEAALPALGHGKPEVNRPFLSTREAFRLKELGHDQRIRAYLERERADRRAYLDELIAETPGDDFAGLDLSRPKAIDTIEWFASAMDLCRLMNRLRQLTVDERAAPAREILAVKAGLDIDTKAWPYVGYKGGSEPGVLNMTWLLERHDGSWFALTAGWNDPQQTLDGKKLGALLLSFLDLVAAPEAGD